MPEQKKVLTSKMTDQLSVEVGKVLKDMKDVEMKGDVVKLNLAPAGALWEISGSYKTN